MSATNEKKVSIIRLDEVDSTQKTARAWLQEGRIREETIVTARFQRTGKGRGNNSWESEKGKNLLLTWVLFPSYLKPERQFSLSAAVALALADLVSEHTEEVSVKWPNDIYVKNKKIAGILLENDIQGDRIVSALAGIGLNVNQTVFPASLPNPVSLKKITGRTYEPDRLLDRLIYFLEKRVKALQAGQESLLLGEYEKRLYRYNRESIFITKEGEIRARITGIDPYGRVVLTDDQGRARAYGMGEVTL